MAHLIRVSAAALAAGSAGAAVCIGLTVGAGPGPSSADPGSNSTLNVVGEPYARAVAILRAQGMSTSFGGSFGSDVPQAQCVVSSQKIIGTSGRMQLMLDCTEAAQPDVPTSTSVANSPTSGQTSATQPPDAGGVPTPGAPGVVTVVPTRVG